MQHIELSELGDMLEQPWLATLATYRKNGSVLLSPVWFEWADGAITISLVHGDWKELHIRRNPQVSVLIAEEASWPGRAAEFTGKATVVADPGGEGILRIATRYLGDEVARHWVGLYPEFEWDLMTLAPEKMRALDHRNVPFLATGEPQYPETTEWRIEMLKMPQLD